MKNALQFQVPPRKRVRMIVDTDCKNEADDQFALAHHLMTPMLDVRGINAAHFEAQKAVYGEGSTMQASYDEILNMLELMDLTGRYRVCRGCRHPLADESTPEDSEAARLIIEEAMREEPTPLFVALQGTLTNLASALLLEPAIPTIISQLINLVYNMADTWFIGRAPTGSETETRPADAQKSY